MIEIILNGEVRALPTGTSVTSALADWGYRCEQIAVAINGEFVTRADYLSVIIQPHDRVDVVAPMQGG